MQEGSEDIILNEEDLQQLCDVKAALLKEKFGSVDVDAAWEVFSKESPKTSPAVDIPEEPVPSQKRYAPAKYISIGVLMGIAASVLCFFLLRPKMAEPLPDGSLLVMEAIDQHPQIEMTTSALPTDNDVSISDIIASDKAQTVKVPSEKVLDFTKMAQSDIANEERVISTPRGKVQTIILADGTKVLLNNESKLRFPTRFTGESRTVWLEGEAYFAVAKDASHPFIVKSRDLSTTALGTKFNVKAYNDKAIHITLVDGSVKVTDGNQQEVILKPGEDVCTVNDKLVITDADTKTYRQWEDGYFYYDNVPLIDVLVELGRWYNINIELQNRRLMSYRLHFIADRNASIDDALERLNEFRYLNVERKGDKIIVSEKNIQQQAP